LLPGSCLKTPIQGMLESSDTPFLNRKFFH
jgi:hypothetical protein